MRPTKRLPGSTTITGDSTDMMAPQILMHEGRPFMVVHAQGFSTGLAVPKGRTPEDGRIIMTTWLDPDGPDEPGMAFSFTPDDAMLDLIIASLTGFRDRQRQRADQAAAAALAKAAGR